MGDGRTLTHIGICVSDIERSIRFYRDALGFACVSELEVAGEPASSLLRLQDVQLRAVYLERDGVRIELLYYTAPSRKPAARPHEMNDLGFTHLSFRVDDVEGTISGLRDAGAAVLEDTVVNVPGMGTVAAFVTDPDGVLIELVGAG